jgi:hypothetical protein
MRSLLFAAALAVAAPAGAAVVADYQADFNTSGTPAPGWSYLWNANGPLGNSANYVPLVHDTNLGGDYETVANGARPDPAPGAFLAASQTAVYPGQTATQAADLVTRYVITAYTFSAAQIAADGNQLLFHTYHFTIPADAPGPIDVEVYKNNTLIAPFPFPPGTDFSDQTFGPDYPFGTVQPGDTLYIAQGASGDYTGQPLGVSYTLALVPEPIAAPALALGALGLLRRRR